MLSAKWQAFFPGGGGGGGGVKEYTKSSTSLEQGESHNCPNAGEATL